MRIASSKTPESAGIPTVVRQQSAPRPAPTKAPRPLPLIGVSTSAGPPRLVTSRLTERISARRALDGGATLSRGPVQPPRMNRMATAGRYGLRISRPPISASSWTSTHPVLVLHVGLQGGLPDDGRAA